MRAFRWKVPHRALVRGIEAGLESFALARGIRRWARCERDAGDLGSYPIFWLRPGRISIEREGPGLQSVRAALPAHLFGH